MIILTQTDTTVGFLSQNERELQTLKSRSSTKPFIKVYKNFKSLSLRIPQNKKNMLRRSKKTTFIVKNTAFRITQDSVNSQILRDMSWSYSTSANQSGKNYERDFCIKKADIIIEDKNGLHEGVSSSLLKINAKKVRKLR